MNLDPAKPDRAVKGNGRLVVGLLCFAAAVRVFIYSAAFPFFNNVDEEYHFDLVVKYSEGHIPHGHETLSDAARPAMVVYSSAEYFQSPDAFPGGKYPPPVWTLPKEQIAPKLQAAVAAG